MTIMAVAAPVLPAAQPGPNNPAAGDGFAALLDLETGTGQDAVAKPETELLPAAPAAEVEAPAGTVAADDSAGAAVVAAIGASIVAVPPIGVPPAVAAPGATTPTSAATPAVSTATIKNVPAAAAPALAGAVGAGPELAVEQPAAIAPAATPATTPAGQGGPAAAQVGPAATPATPAGTPATAPTAPATAPATPELPGPRPSTVQDQSGAVAPGDSAIVASTNPAPPHHAAAAIVNPAPVVGSGAPGPTPVPVTRQVFPEVVKVFSANAGTHRLTLQLHPEQLGEVRVVLTVHQGTVRVSLSGSAGAELILRHGAPELQRLLESSGAHDARIVVGDAGASNSASSGASAEPGDRGSGWYRQGTDGHGATPQQSSGHGRDWSNPPTGSAAPVRLAAPHPITRSAGVDLTI